MGAAENKQLMEGVFAELANGNGQPFMDMLGDDIRWTVTGTSEWSRTYEGKRSVIDELMRPLFSQFAEPTGTPQAGSSSTTTTRWWSAAGR